MLSCVRVVLSRSWSEGILQVGPPRTYAFMCVGLYKKYINWSTCSVVYEREVDQLLIHEEFSPNRSAAVGFGVLTIAAFAILLAAIVSSGSLSVADAIIMPAGLLFLAYYAGESIHIAVKPSGQKRVILLNNDGIVCSYGGPLGDHPERMKRKTIPLSSCRVWRIVERLDGPSNQSESQIHSNDEGANELQSPRNIGLHVCVQDGTSFLLALREAGVEGKYPRSVEILLSDKCASFLPRSTKSCIRDMKRLRHLVGSAGTVGKWRESSGQE